jgi:hypothetical protein
MVAALVFARADDEEAKRRAIAAAPRFFTRNLEVPRAVRVGVWAASLAKLEADLDAIRRTRGVRDFFAHVFERIIDAPTFDQWVVERLAARAGGAARRSEAGRQRS